MIAAFQVSWLSFAWTVCGIVGGVLFLVWGIVSGFRRRSKIASDQLHESRAELVLVTKQQADVWRARFDTEHAEYIDYRQKQHDQAQEVTARLLALTNENADLKAKTDLTPILIHQKEQTIINAKVVRALDAILLHMEIRNGVPASAALTTPGGA